MRRLSIKPPKNDHSVRCKDCAARLVPLEGEKPIWWIQISRNVYCEKCYERKQKSNNI